MQVVRSRSTCRAIGGCSAAAHLSEPLLEDRWDHPVRCRPDIEQQVAIARHSRYLWHSKGMSKGLHSGLALHLPLKLLPPSLPHQLLEDFFQSHRLLQPHVAAEAPGEPTGGTSRSVADGPKRAISQASRHLTHLSMDWQFSHLCRWSTPGLKRSAQVKKSPCWQCTSWPHLPASQISHPTNGISARRPSLDHPQTTTSWPA